MGLSFPATWRCAFLILTTVPLSNCRASPPYAFDSAPPGEHAVSHVPDTCMVCDLYYDAQASVVRIRSTKTQGAGVVVSTSGQILTNAHVVNENDRPQIETRNGDIFDAKVVRTDQSLDLALLQAEGDVITWIPLQLKPTGMPRVGSDVYVVGHPMGLGWTVSRGIVSATRKPGEVWRTAIIQTDAAISPGNSGGPLLNRHGNLVGLVVSQVRGAGAENVAFAIPASVIMAFLNDSESTSSPSPDALEPRPRHDAARRSWQIKSDSRRVSRSLSSTVIAEPQAQIQNQSAEELYRLGKEALSADKYKKSIRFLEQAAVHRTMDVELHYWLGVAYWNREQGVQAIDSYRLAVELDAEAESEWSLYALGNLAEVYTRTDHAREARDTYRQSLLRETRPEWITKIHNQIAELDLALGEYVPNDDTVYNERGEIIGGVGPGLMHTNRNFEIARQTNDPVKEEKYYRLAIATEPEMYQPYFNLGLALVHQGRFEDALRWLAMSDEVWKRDSYTNPRQTDKTDAHAFLALCYVELGDLDQAAEHARRALTTGELNYWATLYSLRVKIERGQADEVLSQLEQLAGANPEHAETLYTLSLAYEASGRHVDAKSMLRKAVDTIPENHPWMDRLRREWRRLLLDADVSPSP